MVTGYRSAIGCILLYKNSNKFIPSVIKYVTKKKYYHSAIYIGDGEIIEISPLKIGIVKLNYKHDFDVYTFNSPFIGTGIKWAKKTLKDVKGYGWGNLFIFLWIKAARKINIKWYEGNYFQTCSEFTSKYLEKCRVTKKKEINSLLSPGDLPDYFYIYKE